MTAQPIEANVVLTTDNTQYDQAMSQSAQSTDKLAHSVDSLGAKINQLSKSAGRKMLGITAGDVAVITGATAAWASYEKQMTRLQAQAAVTTRSQAAQNQVMKDYTASVQNLRSQFGTTTTEAAALTQQISKLADSTSSIKSLSTTFEQMSQATGESSTGLANSLLNLQKIMGTPQSQTRNYADQLTYLAAKSNTSATALAEFTSQIAPMGRAMGMSQTQVTGFSNMFIKAGQDGYSAATAFNKVAQDITQAVQTGSPDMLKYANVLGVTVQQFKQMSGAQQVAGFLDQIAKMGPRAALELNRFGFDGVRMAKAITGTVQASGGAMNALNEANVGFNSDAVDKGSDAAENMSVTLSKLRQDLQQTAEAFGSVFGPSIEKVLKVVEMMASGFQNLMSGPLGKFVAMIAGVAVPVTAAAGALLLLAGTLTKLAAAFALFRGAPALGFMEGLRGGSRIVPEEVGGMRTGGFVAAGGGMLGRRGAQIAEGGTWFQRGTYNAGQTVGGGLRAGGERIGALPVFMSGEEGGPSRFSMGAGRAVRFGGQAFTTQYDAMRYANPADRTQFFGRYFPGQGPQVEEQAVALGAARTRLSQAQGVQYAVGGAQGSTEEMRKAAEAEVTAAKAEVAALEKAEAQTLAFAEAQANAAKMTEESAVKNEGVFASMRAEGANVARAFAGAATGAARFAAESAVGGAAAAGSGLMSALGGPVGIGLTAAMMAPLIIPLVSKMLPKGPAAYQYQNLSGAGSAYLAAGGITSPSGIPTGAAVGSEQAPPRNMTAARAITQTAIVTAQASSHQLSDKNLSGMSQAQAMAYLGPNFKLYNPAAMNALKLDLIDRFGPGAADSMLTDLQKGNYVQGATPFLQAAQAGQSVNENINLAGGMLGAQSRAAYATGGVAGVRQANATGISTLLKGALNDPRNSKGILDQLNRNFGVSLTQSDLYGLTGQTPGAAAAVGRYSPTAAMAAGPASAAASGTPTQRLQYAIENLPSTQANALRSRLGIAADVSGADLTQAIQATLGTAGAPASTTPGSYEQRVRQTGPAGRMFESSGAVQAALGYGAQNVGANVKAINDMMDKMRTAGMAAPAITKAMGDIQSHFDPTDPNYILAGMVSGQAQQELSLAMPNMTRAAGFSAQVGMFQAVASVKPVSPEQYQNAQDAKANMASAMTDQESYFKQMLLMQDQYEIQRGRQQAAYTLQRGYEEHDYQLQRSRAETQYNLQRNREQADYDRQVKEANYEFNLQRQRAEDDFDHSVEVQAKQMAQSVYDIYSRVQVQRTASASSILSNAQDQLQRMQDQEKDLRKLRAEGLNNNVIQQMGLTDPKNQQQLARFVTELTPQMIAQFNKTAGGERVKAAKDLMTDPSSLEWEETRRSYELQQKRTQHDFQHQMDLGQQNFERSLRQQQHDFNVVMNNQATDFATQMSRQEAQYQLTMEQAAQDLANVGKEIDGNFEQILTKGVNQLTGHAQQQAAAVLKSFKHLKSDTEPEAVALMQSLSKIFGFKYQAPSGVNTTPVHEQKAGDQSQRGTGVQVGQAEGGIVPGWSPGRDTTMVPLSGGEAIMRPEWARAMGGAAIEAMNHAAKHGGFAGGGVYRPINEQITRGLHDQYTGYSAVDLAAPVGTSVYAVDSGTITQSYDIRGPLPSDQYHNSLYGPYGSYGRVMYLRTDMGPEVLYAHLSQRGLAAGQHVGAGQPIALSGSTGNSSGPHLHFGDNDGNPYEFITNAMLSHGAIKAYAGSSYAPTHLAGGAQAPSGAGIASLSSILKNRYPRAEAAAWAMQGAHPLNPGDISHILNAMTRNKYRALKGGRAGPEPWFGDGGIAFGAQQIGVAEAGPEAVIPLNDQGAAFLAQAMHGAEARGIGMGSSPIRGGLSVYNTRIDRSTNFTGPITVQANDPNELLNKLQARQRVMALSRPSLTGSAA